MDSNEKKSKRPRIGQIRTATPETDITQSHSSENGEERPQRQYRQDYHNSYQSRNNYSGPGQRPYGQRSYNPNYNRDSYQSRPRYNSPDADVSQTTDVDSVPSPSAEGGDTYRHQNSYNQGYRRNNQGYNSYNNRQGGYNNPNRQGGYNNRQGGYNSPNRQGGYNNRQGGYNNKHRQHSSHKKG